MNTASEGQWQEWDESTADAPKAPTAGSRRLLLGGVAGGFALAASGLLLPDRFVDEVEAREGANGGALGGRHGKDHKGRHRRRNRDRKRHDRRDDSGNARGKGPQRDVMFSIYNGQSSPQDVQVWTMTQDSYLNDLYTVKWTDTIDPGQTRPYASQDHRLLVTRPDYHIEGAGPIYAEGFNTWIPFVDPTLTFGWLLPGFTGYTDKMHDKTTHYLKEGGPSVTSWGFKARHEGDSNTYVRFLIELTAS